MVVPIVLVVCILVAIDYADLADKTVGYVLALFIATQFVGWGEEGMFRGIGVVALRSHGLTEGKVALWSSLVFGAVHLSNAIGHGAQAIPQALAVSFAGYFFYLTRRVSGGNALNSVLHGLFDFSLLSGTVILVDQDPYVGSACRDPGLRRHRGDPADPPAPDRAADRGRLMDAGEIAERFDLGTHRDPLRRPGRARQGRASSGDSTPPTAAGR